MSKPLTMTEGREELIREVVGESVDRAESGGTLYAAPLLAEVDALRAALAAAEDRLVQCVTTRTLQAEQLAAAEDLRAQAAAQNAQRGAELERAELALADERRHADRLNAALAEFGEHSNWCFGNPCDCPTGLAIAAHAARRAAEDQ